jgi:hypothetical protein
MLGMPLDRRHCPALIIGSSPVTPTSRSFQLHAPRYTIHASFMAKVAVRPQSHSDAIPKGTFV